MKRLDRYLLKELSIPLLIGTVVFALLFMANDMIFIYKSFNVDQIPFMAILQMLFYKFPFWLNVTLPIGTSLGCSLAISRLARESELTAMRAAGVPIARVFVPLLFAGAVMSVANYIVVEKVVPPSSRSYRKLMNEVGVLAAMPAFKQNVMMSIDRYSASFKSVQKIDNNQVLMRDIVLIERPRPGEVYLYMAGDGNYKGGVWRIKAPTVVHLKGTIVLSLKTNDDVVINEPVRIADLFAPPSPEETSAAELLEAIKQGREHMQPTASLEVKYHQKFAVPAACFIFAFTGAIFAVRFAKAGPFIGVMVSLGIVWLYFNIYVIAGDILGKYAWMPPVGAAWLPNVLFGACSLIFVRRLE